LGSQAEIAQYMDELHDIHGFVKVASYEELKGLVLNITGEGTSTSEETVSNSDKEDEEENYLSHLKGIE
jgi:hypothetical protein